MEIGMLDINPPTKGKAVNTLVFHPGRCINCGMCLKVCPHRVFAAGDRRVRLDKAHLCMECGACSMNCPSGAIAVDSGVGCAAAMIMAALKGRDEAVCGEDCCR